MRIPGARFEPGTGDAHRVAVLTALALFGDAGRGEGDAAVSPAADTGVARA
jgi:hypothetical protein